MKLIPFDPLFAESVQKFYLLPEYSHFARGMGRYLTLDECRHLPQVVGQEILLVINDTPQMVGLVALKDQTNTATNFSIVLDTAEQMKGFGYKTLEEIEEYCFKIRNSRMVTTEILTRDEWLGVGLKKKGYQLAGTMPGYNIVNGKEEDVSIFYKKR